MLQLRSSCFSQLWFQLWSCSFLSMAPSPHRSYGVCPTCLTIFVIFETKFYILTPFRWYFGRLLSYIKNIIAKIWKTFDSYFFQPHQPPLFFYIGQAQNAVKSMQISIKVFKRLGLEWELQPLQSYPPGYATDCKLPIHPSSQPH